MKKKYRFRELSKKVQTKVRIAWNKEEKKINMGVPPFSTNKEFADAADNFCYRYEKNGNTL